MGYKDIRISSYTLSPKETDELYERRYNSDSALRLGFDIKGHDAFIVHNAELSTLISSIYQLDKKLSLLSKDIPDDALTQFVKVSMIEEIQQSNEVENVNSTRKEIKDALITVESGGKKKRFESMVRKYLALLSNKEIPLSTCQHIRNLYDEFILNEIVKDDPNDSPDGELFRKSKVFVKNNRLEVIHEGVNPESAIIMSMNTALSVLNNDKVDILIRVALFHYFFGYIHPFYNGNGRMSRFISSYILSKYFSVSACLRISYIIKEHRKKYYELFKNANNTRNRGELTEFVIGYLSFFEEAIKDTYSTLDEKYKLYKEYEDTLDRCLKKFNGLSIMQRVCFHKMLQIELFGDTYFDIASIATYMECSTKTARKILDDAGDFVISLRDGKKKLWHINIKKLSLLGAGLE